MTTYLDSLLMLTKNGKLEITYTGFEYTLNYSDEHGGFCCGGATLPEALQEAEEVATKYVAEVTA